MLGKYFAAVICIILIGCNETVSKKEYIILSDKNSELQTANSLLKIEHKDLLRKYNEIQREYTALNKKYLIIRNIHEIIEYEKQLDDVERELKRTKSYIAVEDKINNLLFDYYDDGMYVFGTTVIEGYYINRTVTYYDDNDVEVDSFVITGGERIYLDSIAKRQFAGNTIYDINENGDPIVNIYINLFNNELQEKVKNSNEEKKIKLKIFITQPTGTDFESVYYPIEILGIISSAQP